MQMKVDVSSLGDDCTYLTVVVDPEEFEQVEHASTALTIVNAGAEVPDGSTPDEVLAALADKNQSLEQAKLDSLLNYLIPRALTQADVIPVCPPEVEPPVMPKEGEPFTFTVGVYPKPNVDFETYEPIAFTLEAPHVTEEEVDAQLHGMAERAVAPDADGNAASIPTIDDAWVKANVPDDDVNTVDELRARVRASGEEFKAHEFEQTKLAKAAEEMAKQLKDEIPDNIVNAMARSMTQDLCSRVMAHDENFDEFLEDAGITAEQLKEETRRQASEMLREGLTLDAVFRRENLTLEDEDMHAAMSALAPGHEKEALDSMKASGYLFTVVETAQRLKAGRLILDRADITVTEPKDEVSKGAASDK